jgi:hypothetical protein
MKILFFEKQKISSEIHSEKCARLSKNNVDKFIFMNKIPLVYPVVLSAEEILAFAKKIFRTDINYIIFITQLC